MKKFKALLTLFLLSCCTNLQNNHELQIKLKPIWNAYFQNNFDDTKPVDIFVVSNRQEKNGVFGCQNQLSSRIDNKLHFGTCQINVPKNHDIGEINFNQNNQESANDYFRILNAKNFSEADLIKILKQDKRTPLVFVHGFNVPYPDAVLRAAGIAYDLKYQGPIILFTWPSGASGGFLSENNLSKTYDDNLINAQNSVTIFKNFLTTLQKNNITVNLMVHSMGHQIALPGLSKLDSKKTVVNELVLNAPDFDVDQFKNLVNNIKQVSNHITLYCSHNDKAMLASGIVNQDNRLGACAFFEGLDTINVSLVDNSTLGLGHSYYSSRAVLNDVFQTLLGIDADKRLFIKKSELGGTEKYFLQP